MKMKKKFSEESDCLELFDLLLKELPEEVIGIKFEFNYNFTNLLLEKLSSKGFETEIIEILKKYNNDTK